MGQVVLGVVIGNQLFDAAGRCVNKQPEPSRELAVRSEPVNPPAPPRVVSSDPVDEIVSLLATATRLAQGLSRENQSRVREIYRAAQAVLAASTVLPRDDQDKFQAALRGSNR